MFTYMTRPSAMFVHLITHHPQLGCAARAINFDVLDLSKIGYSPIIAYYRLLYRTYGYSSPYMP